MYIFKIIILINFVGNNGVLSNRVSTSFNNANITPDPIPKAPCELLHVTYMGDVTVNLGNTLTTVQVVKQPSIGYKANPDCYYTLLMIDLDALFPGVLELPNQYLHWGVGNIRGCDVSSGETLAIYLSPTPPPESPPHRYVLLIYVQDGLIQFDKEDFLNTMLPLREVFDTRKFVDKHKLGNPDFGNFYYGIFA